MKTRALVAFVCALILAGCGGGVKVNTDWDSGASFSDLQTYSWLPDAQSDGSGQAVNQLTDQRIRSAIDADMQAKGFRKVTSGADFMVGYQVTSKDNVSYDTVGTAWGGGGYRYGGRGPGRRGGVGVATGTSTTRETHQTVGTLVIAVFDADSKDNIWHGSGEGAVKDGGTPEERGQRVSDAVSKILEEFPPTSS